MELALKNLRLKCWIYLVLSQHSFIKYGLLVLLVKEDGIFLSEVGLDYIDPATSVERLSVGERHLVEVARLIAHDPQLLILDEPTNHLDLPAIMWLEKFLSSTKCATVLVSHDTKFLNKNANRILDISNKTIKDFRGTYLNY